MGVLFVDILAQYHKLSSQVRTYIKPIYEQPTETMAAKKTGSKVLQHFFKYYLIHLLKALVWYREIYSVKLGYGNPDMSPGSQTKDLSTLQRRVI